MISCDRIIALSVVSDTVLSCVCPARTLSRVFPARACVQRSTIFSDVRVVYVRNINPVKCASCDPIHVSCHIRYLLKSDSTKCKHQRRATELDEQGSEGALTAVYRCKN